MSVLRKEADVLRASAARLEAAADDTPRSALDLLKRFGPPVLNVEIHAELYVFGDSGFNARRHFINQAGQQLAHSIAEKMEFEYVAEYHDPLKYPIARYRCSIYAMAPGELKRLLEKAYRAGRESR
jgi:hypothetical protein